jgi:hypothetical protein
MDSDVSRFALSHGELSVAGLRPSEHTSKVVSKSPRKTSFGFESRSASLSADIGDSVEDDS